MDENEEQSLDSEYKRYLEILRPYLGQLLDEDVIEICKAWIQRLSYCKQNEKVLRNKYIFNMCYQLAKGILEEPFLQNPTTEDLAPIKDSINSDGSVNESSEVEYLVLDLESNKTKVLYNNNNNPPPTEISRSSEYYETDQSEFRDKDNNSISPAGVNNNKQSDVKNKHTIACYNCPNTLPNYANMEVYNDNYYIDNQYEHRATNLIMKLRDIKMQNLLLHSELAALKEDAKIKQEYADISKNNFKTVDNATSVHIQSQESTTTLNCLKSKLQEVQDARKSLIETISDLQDKLINFEEMKLHEIEDINAQHKLAMIQLKTSVREEYKINYDKIIEDIKQQNEKLIKDIENKHSKDIEIITGKGETAILEKDKTIQSMESEIRDLRKHIEGLKNNQFFMFSNFLDRSPNEFSAKCTSHKTEELERRLNKMEKSKIKITKAYEAKLENVQKKKHLAECSLQLQLAKQRAQAINDTADEHQTELATALDKLEGKYKDIVASVQATAVQRRIQDQMALESIIQTISGIRNENCPCNDTQATFPDQLPSKALRTQTRDNRNCDTELRTTVRGNKVGSVIVGNKAFAGENGYCLDGEIFSELFERVCVPQRDTGECSPKK